MYMENARIHGKLINTFLTFRIRVPPEVDLIPCELMRPQTGMLARICCGGDVRVPANCCVNKRLQLASETPVGGVGTRSSCSRTPALTEKRYLAVAFGRGRLSRCTGQARLKFLYRAVRG